MTSECTNSRGSGLLLTAMAARSRRNSTMASSIATQSLARQREEMHDEHGPRYPTGKRKASRPKTPREPKPKKPRQPRRWAPAGWDKTRRSARSIHPGGLECHHVPDMSAFHDAMPSVESSGSEYARLSWLRPHNRVSIWEHLAALQRRSEREAAASLPASGRSLSSAPASSGEGTLVGATTDGDIIIDDSSYIAPRPVESKGAAAVQGVDGKSEWPDQSNRGTAISRVDSTCDSTISGGHGPAASHAILETPFASYSANRASILSLVGAT